MLSEKNFLLGLTTSEKSDWRDKAMEIDEFQIEEIALLLNGLNIIQRKSLYELLDKSLSLKRIPIVYLRADIEEWEVDYFVSKFSTKILSCAADKDLPLIMKKLEKYRQMIFVENNSFSGDYYDFFNKEKLNSLRPAGLCFNLANLEFDRIYKKRDYQKSVELYKKYFVGCNYVCGFKKRGVFSLLNKGCKDYLHSLAELSYLINIDKTFFSYYIVISLENSFLEQLEIKKYIEETLIE
jgi:hypothetical protein